MLAVRDMLRSPPYDFVEKYKWRIPVYYDQDHYICYLYHEVKSARSYMAFINGRSLEHPLLRSEGRKQMRFIVLNPAADLPLDAIADVLSQVLGRG